MNSSRRYLILFLYLVFISILFCLPGSSLPKNDWLAKIWFDKWVHLGIFAFLSIILCWSINRKDKSVIAWIFIGTAIYGMLVEIVQDQFIPNRSFDIGDWVADALGSIIGLVLWRYIKKIDPCGNRGRNQN